MADNDIHPFSAALETWYASHGRDLPWRGTHDPYRIWVSEIILQQTRVAQGYDYFMRFMERFPTVERLAAATEDDVLHAWQGLGYYTRARNLHAAARAVVAQGGFPADYAGVRALRGVGDYTAAAICSMAYGLPHAVVDGNVYRVLSRYFGLSTPIDTTSGRRAFADLAASLLDRRRPGLYNQAVMDFGALQCLPRAPQCGTCPLAPGCEALRTGRVDELPVKARRTQVAERFIAYIYIYVSRATSCSTVVRPVTSGQGSTSPFLSSSTTVRPNPKCWPQRHSYRSCRRVASGGVWRKASVMS